MVCTHTERCGHLFDRQVMGWLNVRTVTTRDVIQRVREMYKPEHRRSFAARDPRHRLIMSAIAAVREERAMMRQFAL